MLDRRDDAKPIASDGQIALFMYGSAEITGPWHILTPEQRLELGVDIAPEGFFSIVIEFRNGPTVVGRWTFPDNGWQQHNAIQNMAPQLLTGLRAHYGV